MKQDRISDYAHRLTRFGLMNAYLVREADGFTLVDTTIGGSGKMILAAAQSLGAPIRRILLTHAHGDHVGSVDEIADAASDVRLLASPRSAPLLNRPPDKSLRPDEAPTPIRGSLPGIKTPITTTVSHGDRVGSLRAIETPGHTPDHLSFLDERDGTLYAGDAVVAVGRLTLPGWTPWYFPLPTMATWSKPIALRSARVLLAETGIRRFACGHGPVRGGGSAALSDAITAAST